MAYAKNIKKSFVLYHDIRVPLELLTDAQRGQLFMAILNYSEHGALPDFDGALLMAFAFIRTSLDRDAEAWAEKQAKRAEAGRNGGLAKAANASNAKQNEANLAVPVPAPVPASVNSCSDSDASIAGGTAATPPRATRFTPPSLAEVQAYVTERNSPVDPQGFIDFYASKGWLIGKSKMKDWKAACRNAERWDRWNKPAANNRVRTDEEYRKGEDFFGTGKN